MKTFILLLGALLLVTGLGAAPGLVFEQTVRHLEIDSETRYTPTHYRFRNASDQPIRVVRVDAACGCTVPRLSQETFAPGESGLLEVQFETGSLSGHVQRAIAVITDEAESNLYQLVLEATITELFTLKPRLLYWRPQEPARAKTVVLQWMHPDTRLLRVEAPSGLFEVETEDLPEASQTRVKVTPLAREPGTNADLILHIARGDDTRKRKLALRILPNNAMPPPF